jgi:hypothetical protein
MTTDTLAEDDDKRFGQGDQGYNNNSDKESKRRQEEVRQIIRECNWTDKLQRLVDYGNANVLKSFQLWLELEEVKK